MDANHRLAVVAISDEQKRSSALKKNQHKHSYGLTIGAEDFGAAPLAKH